MSDAPRVGALLTPKQGQHRAVSQLNLQLGGSVILVLEVNRDSPEVFCKLCQPRVVADGFWARFGIGHSLARRVGAAGDNTQLRAGWGLR